MDFDLAGGDFGVDRLALANQAPGDQDILGVDRSRLLKDLPIGVVVEHQLHHAGAVAQVDKDQVALVALFLHPSANDFFLAHVGFGKPSAVAGPLQTIHCLCHNHSPFIANFVF